MISPFVERYRRVCLTQGQTMNYDGHPIGNGIWEDESHAGQWLIIVSSVALRCRTQSS